MLYYILILIFNNILILVYYTYNIYNTVLSIQYMLYYIILLQYIHTIKLN